MKNELPRRNFLAAGLMAPAAGLGSRESKLGLAFAPESGTAAGLKYRVLGKTGLKVTTVGFGCMTTSDPAVIERAADTGINYFDTARGYQGGNNEKMVGAALKSRRKNIVLSSKSHAATKEDALRDLDKSLSELGTDHLDVWYLHAKSKIGEVTDELIAAQQEAKKAGKIRFAGVSTHSGQVELIPALVTTGKVDVILSAYNFTLDSAIDPVLEDAAKAGVGIVAMKVMAGGTRRMKPGDPAYMKFKREGATLAMLKWAIRRPCVHTSIPGITDFDQLEENMKAMSSPFGDGDKRVLEAYHRVIDPVFCRMCNRCEGTCAKGLPVADVLRFLMYAEGYGEFALGREQFQMLPAEHVSVRCADCSRCTVECPYPIRIAERVSRAQELLA